MMNTHKKVIVILMSFVSMQAAQIAKDVIGDVMRGTGSALSAELEEEVERLEEYKKRKYAFEMDLMHIKEFLNNQISDFGIHPEQVDYYVGDKWLFKKIGTDKYRLIIPSDLPSLLETHKMVFGQKYAPEHIYNINALDALLRKNNAQDDPLFHKYRLEIIKVLMKTKVVDIPTLFSNISKSVAGSVAGGLIQQLDAHLGYIMTGLQALYSQVAGMQDEEMVQIDIDRYLLKTHDIDLIKARIDELEALVNQQEGSTLGRAQAWISRNVLQSGSSTYTKKRLDLLKNYLNENDLELRMFKKFKENQSNKSLKK